MFINLPGPFRAAGEPAIMPGSNQPIALDLDKVLDELLAQFIVLMRVRDEDPERSLLCALHGSVRQLPGNGKCLSPNFERGDLLIAPLLLGDLRYPIPDEVREPAHLDLPLVVGSLR